MYSRMSGWAVMDCRDWSPLLLESLTEELQGGAGGQGTGPRAPPPAPSSLPQPEPLLLLLLPLLMPQLQLPPFLPLLRHVLCLELLSSSQVHFASPASFSSLLSPLGRWGSTLPWISSLLELGPGQVWGRVQEWGW